MAADEMQRRSGTGFSGLSTLLPNVEDGCDASKPVLTEASVPILPPPSDPPSLLIADATGESGTDGKSDSSSDVATGKWMVGIGLGIGILVIIIANAHQNEDTRSTTVQTVHAPTAAAPAYLPPTVASATARQQPAHEAVIQQSAATESADVLGQRIAFSNPRGYCTLGTSAREVELADLVRRSLGEGTRLVHAAVRCSELEDYRKGRRKMLDHWLQIQLIGVKGNFQRVEMPREAFLSALSKSSPVVSAAALNLRLKESLKNSDISLSDVKFDPLGRDGNAVYFSMRINMSVGETSRPISGISGITLLNSLPLSVNVYEGTGSPQSRGQLQAVQQELLSSLLTEN